MRTTKTGTPLYRVAIWSEGKKVKNGGVGRCRLCWSHRRTLVWFGLADLRREIRLFLLWPWVGPCAVYGKLTWRAPSLRCGQAHWNAGLQLVPFFSFVEFLFLRNVDLVRAEVVPALLEQFWTLLTREALGLWRQGGCSFSDSLTMKYWWYPPPVQRLVKLLLTFHLSCFIKPMSVPSVFWINLGHL